MAEKPEIEFNLLHTPRSRPIHTAQRHAASSPRPLKKKAPNENALRAFGRDQRHHRSRARRGARLELRQPVLRSRLVALLDSFITSGLYDDESSGDFASFVAHVQKELSISPRTILLQQLNAKLAHLVDTRADASELHVLLGLPRGAPIARLADALEALGAGRAHARWSAAAAAGRKTSALAQPQLRAKIVGGLRAKAAARGEAALSEAAVAATLDRLEAEEEARRLRSAESAVELWDAVARDETYERWSRAHALWRSSGAERLWADFVELDRREGEERARARGCFEDRAAACFALLVLRLQSEARPPPPSRTCAARRGATSGRSSSARSTSSCSATSTARRPRRRWRRRSGCAPDCTSCRRRSARRATGAATAAADASARRRSWRRCVGGLRRSSSRPSAARRAPTPKGRSSRPFAR